MLVSAWLAAVGNTLFSWSDTAHGTMHNAGKMMAERVGFEFTRKRSFNNIASTAGTVKAMEDSGKQC